MIARRRPGHVGAGCGKLLGTLRDRGDTDGAGPKGIRQGSARGFRRRPARQQARDLRELDHLGSPRALVRRPARPRAFGDRARRGRDDGEPELRPHPGLAAGRRRSPERLVVRDPRRQTAQDLPPTPTRRVRLRRPRPLVHGRSDSVQRRQDGRIPHRHQERRVRHQLLQGNRPALHGEPCPALHDV